MTTINEIHVDKSLFLSQMRGDDTELWILIDYNKQDIQMYCNGPEEEQKIKYNFIKMAKKYGFVKSDKEFWSQIKDVTIRTEKNDLNSYVIRYEFE